MSYNLSNWQIQPRTLPQRAFAPDIEASWWEQHAALVEIVAPGLSEVRGRQILVRIRPALPGQNTRSGTLRFHAEYDVFRNVGFEVTVVQEAQRFRRDGSAVWGPANRVRSIVVSILELDGTAFVPHLDLPLSAEMAASLPQFTPLFQSVDCDCEHMACWYCGARPPGSGDRSPWPPSRVFQASAVRRSVAGNYARYHGEQARELVPRPRQPLSSPAVMRAVLILGACCTILSTLILTFVVASILRFRLARLVLAALLLYSLLRDWNGVELFVVN